MRPGPTQADILLPFVGDRNGIIELLDNIVEKTEIACRIVVCDDGNQAGVMEGIRVFAAQSKIPLVAFRNELPLGWTASIKRCRGHIDPQHEWFVVLPPDNLIESAHWFGHLMAPLQRDALAYAAMSNPDIPWTQNPPLRMVREPKIRRTLTMFRRRSNPPIPDGIETYGAELFRASRQTGNTVWEVPAVRVKPSLGGLFRFVELSAPELKKRAGREPMVAINR